MLLPPICTVTSLNPAALFLFKKHEAFEGLVFVFNGKPILLDGCNYLALVQLLQLSSNSLFSTVPKALETLLHGIIGECKQLVCPSFMVAINSGSCHMGGAPTCACFVSRWHCRVDIQVPQFTAKMGNRIGHIVHPSLGGSSTLLSPGLRPTWSAHQFTLGTEAGSKEHPKLLGLSVALNLLYGLEMHCGARIRHGARRELWKPKSDQIRQTDSWTEI